MANGQTSSHLFKAEFSGEQPETVERPRPRLRATTHQTQLVYQDALSPQLVLLKSKSSNLGLSPLIKRRCILRKSKGLTLLSRKRPKAGNWSMTRTPTQQSRSSRQLMPTWPDTHLWMPTLSAILLSNSVHFISGYTMKATTNAASAITRRKLDVTWLSSVFS